MRPIANSGDPFETAVAQIRAVSARPEFLLAEAPAPARLAPSALAVTVEMADPDAIDVSGRFVLLHDPDGVDEWEGSFRCVIFVRAELEPEMIDDPLLPDVAWTWVLESLADLAALQVGGTVTRSSGRSFGTMAERPSEGTIEVRASWTPAGAGPGTLDDLGRHATAWLDLVAQSAGLHPLPHGVVPVMSRRRS